MFKEREGKKREREMGVEETVSFAETGKRTMAASRGT
jgi:hypothetical protein